MRVTPRSILCLLLFCLVTLLPSLLSSDLVAAADRSTILAPTNHDRKAELPAGAWHRFSNRINLLSTPSGNLIVNKSFEDGPFSPMASPDGWDHENWSWRAIFTWDGTQAYVGNKSVKIVTSTPNDARWTQTVTVQPHTTYLLSGWIKTENVAHTAESEDVGANLSLNGTTLHSNGLFGTNDWTYTSLLFNSGDDTQVTVAARLGFWWGTTTGTAWFDGLQLTPVEPSGQHPPWKILVLIYTTTDFSYTDGLGQHRVIATMTQAEIDRAADTAIRFIESDVPALTSGNMHPIPTVRYPEQALADLEPISTGYWPSMESTAPERDPTFDSVIVVWDSLGIDVNTGQVVELLPPYCGLTSHMGTTQTYATMKVTCVASNNRNIFKHEWGHSILFYFDAIGTAPKPAVDNHINDTTTRYVHCPTGESYILQDETDDNPIPNSIYNNETGFTHDYYSGTTATPDQPTRCLGITPQAWAMGGPVSRPERTSFYDLAIERPPARSAAPGTVVTHTLRITNTGNTTDTFDLTVAGNDWPSIAPIQIGPLLARAGSDADISVTIPPDATYDASDTVTITIVSHQDAGAFATAILTTAIDSRFYSLEIGKHGPSTATVGEQITYTLTVTNSGKIIATGLTITDIIPNGVNYVNGGTLLGDTVSWTIDYLAANDAMVQVSLIVSTTTPTIVLNDNYGVGSSGGFSSTGTIPITTVVSAREPAIHRIFLPIILGDFGAVAP